MVPLVPEVFLPGSAWIVVCVFVVAVATFLGVLAKMGQAKEGQTSRRFFGLLPAKAQPPVAKLGNENSMYYHEELKQWVERGQEEALLAAKRAEQESAPPQLPVPQAPTSTGGTRPKKARYAQAPGLTVAAPQPGAGPSNPVPPPIPNLLPPGPLNMFMPGAANPVPNGNPWQTQQQPQGTVWGRQHASEPGAEQATENGEIHAGSGSPSTDGVHEAPPANGHAHPVAEQPAVNLEQDFHAHQQPTANGHEHTMYAATEQVASLGAWAGPAEQLPADGTPTADETLQTFYATGDPAAGEPQTALGAAQQAARSVPQSPMQQAMQDVGTYMNGFHDPAQQPPAVAGSPAVTPRANGVHHPDPQQRQATGSMPIVPPLNFNGLSGAIQTNRPNVQQSSARAAAGPAQPVQERIVRSARYNYATGRVLQDLTPSFPAEHLHPGKLGKVDGPLPQEVPRALHGHEVLASGQYHLVTGKALYDADEMMARRTFISPPQSVSGGDLTTRSAPADMTHHHPPINQPAQRALASPQRTSALPNGVHTTQDAAPEPYTTGPESNWQHPHGDQINQGLGVGNAYAQDAGHATGHPEAPASFGAFTQYVMVVPPQVPELQAPTDAASTVQPASPTMHATAPPSPAAGPDAAGAGHGTGHSDAGSGAGSGSQVVTMQYEEVQVVEEHGIETSTVGYTAMVLQTYEPVPDTAATAAAETADAGGSAAMGAETGPMEEEPAETAAAHVVQQGLQEGEQPYVPVGGKQVDPEQHTAEHETQGMYGQQQAYDMTGYGWAAQQAEAPAAAGAEGTDQYQQQQPQQFEDPQARYLAAAGNLQSMLYYLTNADQPYPLESALDANNPWNLVSYMGALQRAVEELKGRIDWQHGSVMGSGSASTQTVAAMDTEESMAHSSAVSAPAQQVPTDSISLAEHEAALQQCREQLAAEHEMKLAELATQHAASMEELRSQLQQAVGELEHSRAHMSGLQARLDALVVSHQEELEQTWAKAEEAGVVSCEGMLQQLQEQVIDQSEQMTRLREKIDTLVDALTTNGIDVSGILSEEEEEEGEEEEDEEGEEAEEDSALV